MTDPLIKSLHASGPATDRLATFGRFVGDWDLDWRGATTDGAPVTAQGRLSFGWVLDGRAVQDVWKVPPAVPGDPGIAGYGFHGSTIRFYDSTIDAWRSTWIEPVNGLVRKFIGKERDGRIVLLSVDSQPHMRWTFRDIQPGSFTWTAEYSTDGGHIWIEDEQMIARRKYESL